MFHDFVKQEKLKIVQIFTKKFSGKSWVEKRGGKSFFFDSKCIFSDTKLLHLKMAHQSTFRQQLKATLVRNLRLKIRDSRKTLMEILIPLYTLGTLIILKLLIPNPNFPAILEPRGDGNIFEHFNQLKNHTIAVLPHGNTSRYQTTQVGSHEFKQFQESQALFRFSSFTLSTQFGSRCDLCRE